MEDRTFDRRRDVLRRGDCAILFFMFGKKIGVLSRHVHDASWRVRFSIEDPTIVHHVVQVAPGRVREVVGGKGDAVHGARLGRGHEHVT